jgi:hypothetical protein
MTETHEWEYIDGEIKDRRERLEMLRRQLSIVQRQRDEKPQ